MGCFLALLALISPRLVLFLLWLFDDSIGRAYDGWIVPVLGFFLLPWTTLSYVAFWDWGSGRHVTGVEWFFVVARLLRGLGLVRQRQPRPDRLAARRLPGVYDHNDPTD